LGASLFLITSTVKGQENWSPFYRTIKPTELGGLKFRYSAFVRVESGEEDAVAHMYAKVHCGAKIGFFKNTYDRPIRTNRWQQFSIEGTVDKDYTQITLGVYCLYNGNFFFDDIRLEVLTAANEWKTVFEDGFENGMAEWKQGTSGPGLINDLFNATLSTKRKSGKQSMLISAKDVVGYGTNNKVGKYADVNGIKLYYEVYGEGHPLVVLHGNGGSSMNAASHYPELQKKYKVIAIDSRAHGKSTDTDAPLTYEVMASDVSVLLDQLKLDSVYVWGQSDGAILGLMLAMNHPRKVKKVLAFGANIQPDTTAIFSWGVIDAQRLAKEGSNAQERKHNQLMVDHPNVPFSDLSKIAIPVLIMAGDRDVIRPEHTVKLFQSIKNSQLCILPGSTHGASWDKEELFLNLLYEFFDKPFTMPDTKSWYK
jgi:pimeloyl-ACP methyl ester carboxylesterase